MEEENYLSRRVVIHCCKDKTITWRTRDQPIFNGVALPVYSVWTEEEAEALAILCCRKMYKEHPLLPGKPWMKVTLDGELDFKQHLDYEDLEAVTDKLQARHRLMRPKLFAVKFKDWHIASMTHAAAFSMKEDRYVWADTGLIGFVGEEEKKISLEYEQI